MPWVFYLCDILQSIFNRLNNGSLCRSIIIYATVMSEFLLFTLVTNCMPLMNRNSKNYPLSSQSLPFTFSIKGSEWSSTFPLDALSASSWPSVYCAYKIQAMLHFLKMGYFYPFLTFSGCFWRSILYKCKVSDFLRTTQVKYKIWIFSNCAWFRDDFWVTLYSIWNMKSLSLSRCRLHKKLTNSVLTPCNAQMPHP